jgi:hypothetical protein
MRTPRHRRSVEAEELSRVTEHPLAPLSLASINDIPEEIHRDGRRRVTIRSGEDGYGNLEAASPFGLESPVGPEPPKFVANYTIRGFLDDIYVSPVVKIAHCGLSSGEARFSPRRRRNVSTPSPRWCGKSCNPWPAERGSSRGHGRAAAHPVDIDWLATKRTTFEACPP